MKLACLSLMRQLDLGKEKWIDLSMWQKDLFSINLPSWVSLRKERVLACPPAIMSEEGEAGMGHYYGLQNTLNHTAERMVQRLDVRPHLKDQQHLKLVLGSGTANGELNSYT